MAAYGPMSKENLILYKINELKGVEFHSSVIYRYFISLSGVAALTLGGDECKLITGFSSREGEEVVFSQPVSTVEHPRINEWLEEVENSMRITLAKFLFNAVSDNKELKSDSAAALGRNSVLSRHFTLGIS